MIGVWSSPLGEYDGAPDGAHVSFASRLLPVDGSRDSSCLRALACLLLELLDGGSVPHGRHLGRYQRGGLGVVLGHGLEVSAVEQGSHSRMNSQTASTSRLANRDMVSPFRCKLVMAGRFILGPY